MDTLALGLENAERLLERARAGGQTPHEKHAALVAAEQAIRWMRDNGADTACVDSLIDSFNRIGGHAA